MRRRTPALTRLIGPCLALLVAFVGMPTSASQAQHDVTGSGLEIELLDFQARCIDACPAHNDLIQTMDFIGVVAVLRITNRSEIDPKPIQPCNLSLTVEDGKYDDEDYDPWWAELDDVAGGLGTSWEEPEERDSRRVNCLSVGKGREPPVARDDSITVVIGGSFRHRAIPHRITVDFHYAGDDDFNLASITDLTEEPFREPRLPTALT